MINTTKLLELMSARMFHDLAGPVGAISNSLEFLEEDNPVIREKAMELIQSSSYESILRLKFFRQAYGTINDKEFDFHNLFNLISEFVEKTKVKLEWNIQDSLVDSYVAKVLMNLVIISLNGMIQGGILSFEQQEKKIIIKLDGQKIILTQDSKKLLKGEIKDIVLSSANIQLYYTFLMLQEAKASLIIEQFPDHMHFIITY